MTLSNTLLLLHIAITALAMLRLALREDISPDARMAWFMIVLLFPVAGYILYFMFGSARIARITRQCHHAVYETVRSYYSIRADAAYLGRPQDLDAITAAYQAPFRYLSSLNNLYPAAGSRAALMADGAAARASIIQDIDNAQTRVSVLYYIWLDDNTGRRTAEALIRAAQRGVEVRAAVDALGSRAFLKSDTWKAMQAAGVKTASVLPIKPWWVIFMRRIDLRNHRKITLIDGKIAYCGSQNCADEAFAIKAKYAPWVDIMLRLEGPIVTQMQMLFATDWMIAAKEAPNDAQTPLADIQDGGFRALVMADGPTERKQSTAQLLVSLITAAVEKLTISTPYFVPDATVLEALCAAAYRGVEVTLIFPAKNDSWVVAAVSRSHYRRLLNAGCRIMEYPNGLLHAKTLTIDGRLTFIGSTNLDLRSFDLNYENNVLLEDAAVTAAVFARQQQYLAQSLPITLAAVKRWPRSRRIWHNLLATVGPVL